MYPRAVGQRSRRRRVVVAVTLLACLSAAGLGVSGAEGTSDAIPAEGADRLVVHLARPANDESEARLASSVDGRHVPLSRPGVFAVETKPGKARDTARKLRQSAGVVHVEPDVRFRSAEVAGAGRHQAAAVLPNEECFSGCRLSFDGGNNISEFSQAEMLQVGAPDAWAVTKGSADILVAVVDTDVDADHPDLAGKVIVGPNFSGDGDPDPEGHGTAVAGLITAQPDNGLGIAGLGWSTKVLSVRVLDSKGSGYASKIADGIEYAMNYPGVRVINLSLQQDSTDSDAVSSTLREAIAAAQRKGILVVAAAGNQGRSTPGYPAQFDGVLSVNAVDRTDTIASFSNRGTWVDLTAPGVEVLSLGPRCECWASPTGTSFAAPFVSAAAALVMAADPSLSAEAVAARLEATADQVAGTGSDFESGRLNVARAVQPVTPPPPPAPSPTPTPAPAPSPTAVPAGSGSMATPPPPAPVPPGYWLAASDGGIFNYGSAGFLGSTGNIVLNKPIVGLADTPSGDGYWLVASDGGIFNFGDARFFGSTGNIRLNHPIVTMAPTPTGQGYWLFASDGGVFSFGDARFFGSTGAMRLNQPIVGMAPTPSGAGYWLVAADGGIFSFGDAGFFGSTGALRLNRPIAAMAATSTGRGYWLVASDGGIFNYGDAAFFGSTAGGSVKNIVALVPTRAGTGYWLAGADGVVYDFGAAPHLGDLRRGPLNRPIVGLAVR